MNCDNLIEKYLGAVAKNSEIRKIGETCVLITPYLHSHGVYITVYADMEGARVKIHDNGETLQSLFSRGVKVFETPTREEIMNDICRSYGVELAGWTIQKMTEERYTGEAIIDLINAVKSANDLIYLHQATTSDIFKFEVRMFLKEKKLSVSPDYKVTGKTTAHKIDFFYHKRETDYFINVLSGTNLQVKVIKSGFSYYDIKETRRKFSWLTIINPEDEWTKRYLNILNKFSTTISWEHKDRLLELLE